MLMSVAHGSDDTSQLHLSGPQRQNHLDRSLTMIASRKLRIFERLYSWLVIFRATVTWNLLKAQRYPSIAHLREAEGVEDAARVARLWVRHAVALEDRVLRRGQAGGTLDNHMRRGD